MDKCFWIEFDGEEPKYIQVYKIIRALIESGKVSDGERLPTIREYASWLGVNKITIINAYKKLCSDGFAYQKMGSGTFGKKKDLHSKFMREYTIRFKKLEESNKEGNIIDFTGETSEDINFPIEDFKEIINAVLDRDGTSALTSRSVLGYGELRRTINKVFWDNTLHEDDILVVSGAQQGIDIASKALININDNVIVENPTYGGALSVFKFRRANVFQVSLEDDGVNLEEFEKILKKNRIRAFYTMSYFQNPTGISYSLEKKKRILELSKKYDFYIIEDDYLSELIYNKDLDYIPFKWLDRDDRVVYIKSFSKIFLPGIRMGYMIAPRAFKEGVRNSKFNTDIATSSLMQRALEMYIREGQWKVNIDRLKIEYIERYKLMDYLIKSELSEFSNCITPLGGVNFYITLKNPNISSKDLFLKLSNKGVYITPGILFYRNEEDGESSFRIGFSQTTPDKIKKGISIIRKELMEFELYNN
ncbi:MAG: PLP-dependent aminotransferase family protein [Clostridium sp.]